MRFITLGILLFGLVLLFESCEWGRCAHPSTDVKLRFDSTENYFVPYNGHDTLVFKWDSSNTAYTFHVVQFEDTLYNEKVFADCPEFVYHSQYRQVRFIGNNNSSIYFRLEKNSTAPTNFEFNFYWYPSYASIHKIGHVLRDTKMFYPSLFVGNKWYQNVYMYMEPYGNDSLYVLVNKTDGILKFKNGQEYTWTLMERR